MALSSVDFPQPDGPSSTRNSPPRDLEVELLEHLHGAERQLDGADRNVLAFADRGHHHPFTAPAAMPRTNQRPEKK